MFKHEYVCCCSDLLELLMIDFNVLYLMGGRSALT